jgi:hypothetical protein
MPNVNDPTEYYRDLAEECRRLAVTTLSAQMRNRYSQMAESYHTLAEAEGDGHPTRRRLANATAQAELSGYFKRRKQDVRRCRSKTQDVPTAILDASATVDPCGDTGGWICAVKQGAPERCLAPHPRKPSGDAFFVSAGASVHKRRE